MTLRPLTPQDLKDYSLAGKQIANGLNTVGVGQPAYLDALINIAIAPSNIVSVTWILTNQPIGSLATLTDSPLGANVPPYNMADRLTLQVAGRAMLRPDAVGQYTVLATITTSTNGTTNLTTQITAANYMGLNVCALCHSGGLIASNIYEPWSHTLHAEAFKDAINGVSTDHFGKNCISCHTVGYDTNALANNGGFDDLWASTGWLFPTNFNTNNFASMPAALRNVANIQCENCHGPGSEHATSLGAKSLISKSLGVGDCAQCHDSLSHHYKTAEWKNSRHAVATRSPSGAGREACIRCHTARGFVDFVATGNPLGSNTVFEAITCAACHDPHETTNPHQLRSAPLYTLPEGTTVTNAGLGALCMQCHHSRNGSASNNVVNYQRNQPTWAGGVSFGPHDSTAGEMVEGVGGIEYGKFIPSGTHNATIPNVCVGCHMQPVASTDPAFTKAGGHSFNMAYSVITNGVTNHVAKVDVCVKCHGHIEDFDMVRKDYNGDGMIEGIQTEVQKLLDRLSTLLPNSTYRADGNYVADGLVKSIGRTSVKTNWPTKFLNAAWNHMFINVEGSRGIHNAPYAVGLLKASIADLTGDSNDDGLPDAWQIQYFGSATAAGAAPNATPAGDVYPNWLKYALGLNPMVPGITTTNGLSVGVVWADGKKLVNPYGATNTVYIFSAAEVAFNTEVGKSYQVQAISAFTGEWKNVGAPIVGTGNAASFVTPTRNDVQQFYRVVATP
ncbi:MAG: hypothetical protein HZA90_13275 [Verrucomicrobia bacterium]|nr:hypothetical protein [Verrucomicrobiota bacterium]